MELVFVTFLVLLVWVMLSICYWTVKNGISPMPTTAKIQRALFKALPEHVEGTIIELGSGWGSLAFSLAKRYPHCQVVGYETSHIPYAVSQLARVISRTKNVQFVRRDFFTERLDAASMAVCYLYPGAMRRLKEKFELEGRAGLVVVSHTFSIPGWTPEKVDEVDDLYKTKIYYYIPRKNG